MTSEYKRGYRDGWNAALDEAESIIMGIMEQNMGVIQGWDGSGTTGNATTGDDSARIQTVDGRSSLT